MNKSKVHECELALKSLLSAEEFTKFCSKHERFLNKFQLDLEEVKRRKWSRDLQDYQTGFVYAWGPKRNMPLFIKNRVTNIDDITHNDVDTAFLGPQERLL